MSRRHAEPFFGGWVARNEAAVRSVPERLRASRRRWVPVAAAVGVAAAVAVPVTLTTAGSAGADPSPNTWLRLRTCESSNRYDLSTGNDHYGAYQFDLATWRSVGGHGYPNRASKGEQDARALILYRERGWQPWQCAGILGLRPDADAGSGYIGDIRVPTGGARTGHGIPAFPGGSHWYTYGDSSPALTVWQDEMHRRGFIPPGTGYYGPITLRAAKRLQRLNGLVPNGFIGPNTWRLAWTGRYSPPGTGRHVQHHPHRHRTRHVSHRSHHRIPAFPGGSHWYTYGDSSPALTVWQDEMHRRGFIPPGTGYYGPITLRAAKRLQRLNGLVPNGFIGPNTWRLAWTGRYRTR